MIYLTVAYEATSDAFDQRFGPPEADLLELATNQAIGKASCNATTCVL